MNIKRGITEAKGTWSAWHGILKADLLTCIRYTVCDFFFWMFWRAR